MDPMISLEEAVQYVVNGPDGETSALKGVVAFLLYWKVWVSLSIINVMLYLLTLLDGPEEVLGQGFMFGIITAGWVLVVFIHD